MNMPEYGALFTLEYFVHQKPMIFISLLVYFSRLLESLVQNSSGASRVPYIAFLYSAYMHFLLRIFLKETELTSSTLWVGMPPRVSQMLSTPRDDSSSGTPRALLYLFPSLTRSPSSLLTFYNGVGGSSVYHVMWWPRNEWLWVVQTFSILPLTLIPLPMILFPDTGHDQRCRRRFNHRLILVWSSQKEILQRRQSCWSPGNGGGIFFDKYGVGGDNYF